MKPTPTFFPRRPVYRGSHRGFSFTEILFAVMILGIGFIMVAAMFPVAIRQTEDSNRETIAASIGRAAYSWLSQMAGQVVTWSGTTPPLTSSVLLPTVPNPAAALTTQVTIPTGQSSLVIPGQVWTFNDTQDSYGNVVYGTGPTPPPLTTLHPALLYSLLSKNLIQATDQRFAWAAFYKRDLVVQGAAGTAQTPMPASFAQIIMVGVQSRAKPAYDPVVDAQLPSTLFPLLLHNVSITAGSAALQTITFDPKPGLPNQVAESAYAIISSDGNTGALNGRVYRLGPFISGTQFYLIPGEGTSPKDPAISNATVYLVGRAPDPANPTSAAGSSQDVSVYSTFVQTP